MLLDETAFYFLIAQRRLSVTKKVFACSVVWEDRGGFFNDTTEHYFFYETGYYYNQNKNPL